MLTQEKLFDLKSKLDALCLNHDIAYEIHGLNKCHVLYLPVSLSKDKLDWLRRKRNSALRFEMDTLDLFVKNKGDELAFSQKYGISLEDYTTTPGSVCVKDESGLLVAVVTVTGLTPQEDHDLAKSVL